MSTTIILAEGLLKKVREGSDGDARSAASELVGVAYERLRVRAHQILRPGDRVRRNLSPTELISSNYLEIVLMICATKPATFVDFMRLASNKLRLRVWDAGHKIIQDNKLLEVEHGPKAPPSPSEEAAMRDLLAAIKRHVDELSAKQRCMMYYLDVAKVTQEEAARRIGVDESTVKREYRKLKPPLIDLIAKHLVGGGAIEKLSDKEKRAAFDACKDAVLDVLWGEAQKELDSLPEEDRALIDCRWCWGLPDEEAAKGLKMDVATLRAKWQELLDRLSPMLRDLLSE